MYDVNFVNSSWVNFTTSDGGEVKPGGQWARPKLGNWGAWSQQYGTVTCHDIGDKHIPGDSRETWGVLISYQGEEWVGRYEGEGKLNIVVNDYGQVTVTGMDFRQVYLPAIQTG